MVKYPFALIMSSVLTVLLISMVESSELSKPIKPVTSYPAKQDISAPLRSIPPVEPGAVEKIREIPLFPLTKKLPFSPIKRLEVDPFLQDWQGYLNMPSPIQNFEGINNVNGVLPPDPNGDVGLSHYVQMVNNSFAIWDKNGNLLYGPAANNTLWNGFGGPCETQNNGDPIVLYDNLADRWLMSQFALPNFPSGPFYQCIAISTTGDPTGQWYRYAFLVHDTKLNDYPKFGVWPDGYYMSVNQFQYNGSTFQWAGAGAFAFERDKMLIGQTAQMIYFDLYSIDPSLGGMLPSHLNGQSMPPSGEPNYFVQFDDNGWGYPQDQLEIWEFHVDWAFPSNSTFARQTILPTAPFDSNLCGYSRNCIPQPGTTAKVDAISERLMYRLQYRNFGTHQSMVVNHTVDVGADHAGIRWYELRNTGSGWSIYQQGTYAPDSNHRWMGSIAMDSAGNISLGYSLSSSSVYPSIAYTGRLVNDPLDTMPQGETILVSGSGSQASSSGRWGDYSSMSIDPSDDCTFWYTQEYYQTTSPAGWRTRVGSFAFPSCTPLITGTQQGTVVDALFPNKPVVNAKITLNSSHIRFTNNSGFYQFLNLPVGTYNVTASANRYNTASVSGVSVTQGNTTTQDISLTCDVNFGDVPLGAWSENYIKSIYCREITNGCSTAPLNYCPSKTVTRQAMAAFLIRAMGETPSSVAYNAYFDDVADNSLAPYINRLYELGITQGCGIRLFCPNNTVKRGPMAVLIIRALGETPSTAVYNAYFDDIADDWFAPYINRFYELGITQGCGARLFCPNKDVTREQAAVFIIRAF